MHAWGYSSTVPMVPGSASVCVCVPCVCGCGCGCERTGQQYMHVSVEVGGWMDFESSIK